MKKESHLFIIPGLSDDIRFLSLLTRHWHDQFDITPHVISFGWLDLATTFEEKLSRMTAKMRPILENPRHDVHFAGVSAGGSGMFNVVNQLESKGFVINGAMISVCARLREGEGVYPNLQLASKKSPAFHTSVQHCEQHVLPDFTTSEKRRILTFQGKWDQLVPASTSTIESPATNIQIPCIEHITNIALAFTWYANTMIDHIQTVESMSHKR